MDYISTAEELRAYIGDTPEKIHELCIDYNFVGELPDFSLFTNLRILHMSVSVDETVFMQLNNLPIEDLSLNLIYLPQKLLFPKLRILHLYFLKEKMSPIEFAMMDSTLIDCSSCTELSEVILRHIPNLNLDSFLWNNKITQLYAFDCGITDISSLCQLSALRKLNLNDNAITNPEPITVLKNLEYIDLSENSIVDCESLYDSSYDFLSLYKNPLANEEIRNHFCGEDLIINRRDKDLYAARKYVTDAYERAKIMVGKHKEQLEKSERTIDILRFKNFDIEKEAEKLTIQFINSYIENMPPGVIRAIPEIKQYTYDFAKKTYIFYR